VITVICAHVKLTDKLFVRTKFVVAPTMGRHSNTARLYLRETIVTCALARIVAKSFVRPKCADVLTMVRHYHTDSPFPREMVAISAHAKPPDRLNVPTRPVDANTMAEPSTSELNSTEMSATLAPACKTDSCLAQTIRCPATVNTAR